MSSQVQFRYQNTMKECDSDDISCTFKNHNIVINDTGFASCIEYEIKSKRLDYTQKEYFLLLDRVKNISSAVKATILCATLIMACSRL